MQKRSLGNSGLEVSKLCLGTMTWGEQNTEAEAFEQMDYAVSQGINFFDTAEMYPVPPKADTQGLTETYIGNWLQKRQCRDQIIIASKVAGPAPWLNYIRTDINQDYGPKFDAANITLAVEESLKRLKTDYIDLYQLHWPDRNTNFFGKLDYQHNDSENATELLDTLNVLSSLIKQGKIRHFGVSNETPWGLMSLIKLAELHNLPKPVSIQNPYNLLNRSFEVGLAECSIRENIPLLAYSPMGFGVLSGKYLDGAKPANARLTLFDRFIRYTGNEADDVVKLYMQAASDHGLSLADMALAFVAQQTFLASSIIGATTIDQLKANIKTNSLILNKNIVYDIQSIHSKHPNPCP